MSKKGTIPGITLNERLMVVTTDGRDEIDFRHSRYEGPSLVNLMKITIS